MGVSIREYFPGSNTPDGFYSYYDYILQSREANRIIVLKGGPGTGKSSFMRRIAKHLVSLGYDTELLHCSSDPNSLDGVCARQIGFLILDGTAPHIVDPKAPGAVDEIINLGDCWQKDKIEKRKDDIINTNEKISVCFECAYSYLAAAKNLQNQIERSFAAFTDTDGIKSELKELLSVLGLKNTYANEGSARKAFLSSFTPLGRLGYAPTFAASASRVYAVKANRAPNCAKFMSSLANSLTEAGIDIRTFYCPMSPASKIEHIYAPDIDTFFTVENAYHTPLENVSKNIVDLDKYVHAQNIGADVSDDLEYYNIMMSRALGAIADAKKLHDELEQCYVPYMDFGKTETLCEKVIKSIN